MRKPIVIAGLAVLGSLTILGTSVQALPLIRAETATSSSATEIEKVQWQDCVRGGFPVWALGPYPSGFGNETRTGRPFYAGCKERADRRYYRSYDGDYVRLRVRRYRYR